MFSYENLDRIADAYNPILAAAWLLLLGRAVLVRGWRTGLVHAGLGVGALLIAYGCMWLDDAYRLWPGFGLDYSTHTAVAFALGVTLFTMYRPGRAAVVLSLAGYFLLMLYQRYHSAGDIASTLLVLATPIYALAYASHRATGGSSGPDRLREPA